MIIASPEHDSPTKTELAEVVIVAIIVACAGYGVGLGVCDGVVSGVASAVGTGLALADGMGVGELSKNRSCIKMTGIGVPEHAASSTVPSDNINGPMPFTVPFMALTAATASS